MKKWWPLWVMLWLAILLILCGLFTVFNPSKFWGIVNIMLWITLVFSGISAIINAIKNQKTQYISLLFAIWILILMLWITLICSNNANFVWKLMVWMFSLWAFMRWGMLIFFGIQNKETHPLRWWILLLGIILAILAITTLISSWATANLIGICIWISFIFDGISLLFFSLRWGNAQVVQAQIISQADENEIAQWDVVVSETVVISDNLGSQDK